MGIEKRMMVTLTCDHRIISGADAALFNAVNASAGAGIHASINNHPFLPNWLAPKLHKATDDALARFQATTDHYVRAAALQPHIAGSVYSDQGVALSSQGQPRAAAHAYVYYALYIHAHLHMCVRLRTRCPPPLRASSGCVPGSRRRWQRRRRLLGWAL